MLTLVVNVLIKNYYTDSGDVRSGDGNNTPVDGDVVQDEVSMKSVPSAELGSQEGILNKKMLVYNATQNQCCFTSDLV